MTKELKPCPFCGGEAALLPLFGGRYMTACKQCDTTMPTHNTYEQAIEAWNTRAEPIVRCKDCKNWCIDTCQLFPTVDEPNGFCAWGERKVVD